MLQRWGIDHVLSTPQRAQGHGAVERLNRTLGQSLRMLDGAPGDWDLRLPQAVSAYNTTMHAELGVTPAQYLLGREHEANDIPRVPLATQHEWRPGHPSFAPFHVGDLVKKAIERPGNLLASKLGPRYIGPLTVTRVNDNGVTYVVTDRGGQDHRAHHVQLRRWKSAPAYLRRTSQRARSLFDWMEDEAELHGEVQRSAPVNIHGPCGLVPQSDTQPEGEAAQLTMSRRSAPLPTSVRREEPLQTTTARSEAAGTSSSLRPCLRSLRQSDEEALPVPQTDSSQPRRVQFQLAEHTSLATTAGNHESGGLRRSSRNRRSSRWLNDYVTP